MLWLTCSISQSAEKAERRGLSCNRVENDKPDNVNARLLFSGPSLPENILNHEATLRASVERLASIIEGNRTNSP